MRSYPVKENPIGSAVSEILWYKHKNTKTNRQTSYYFIIRKFLFLLQTETLENYVKSFFMFRVFASVSSQLDPDMNLSSTFFKPQLLRLSGE